MTANDALLLKGGRVITASDDYHADVLVQNGRIQAIASDFPNHSGRTLDCVGQLLLPGGIDPHTHMDTPIPAGRTCDDFTSGTVAAAFGGTTTIIDFCQQNRGESLFEALEGWHEKLATRPPVIDVGFHIIVSDLVSGGSFQQLARLPSEGITSYKIFMAYKDIVMLDDETVYRVMASAAQSGALVMVHAENGGAIEVLIEDALSQGNTEPIWHARTRPASLEGEATDRAIKLAELAGCPLYIVHVSCREAVEAIAEARKRGQRVWGETCPHYLQFDESVLEQAKEEAVKYLYSPPPRAKHHQEHLWRALNSDILSVVSTDHGPFMLADKLKGDDFTQIPNGAVGVEQRLMILHEFGVNSGTLSINRMVSLLSTTPAKLFGLYPRKGTIAVGSDADIVVFDPNKRVRISASIHHSKVDFNLYEGTEVVGAPTAVLVRGVTVVEDGKLVVEPGHGQFLRRAPFGELTSG